MFYADGTPAEEIYYVEEQQTVEESLDLDDPLDLDEGTIATGSSRVRR